MVRNKHNTPVASKYLKYSIEKRIWFESAFFDNRKMSEKVVKQSFFRESESKTVPKC